MTCPARSATASCCPTSCCPSGGLDIDLTAEQKATLSREEVGSITSAGIRFEAVLEAGLAMQVVTAPDLTDPRITYILHEIGEETRHQRLFIRLLEQIRPDGRQPVATSGRCPSSSGRVMRWITRLPALLYTLILGGEEIPDLFQKLASEHPDTDPFMREVNRYHRQEEARHLSFARSVLPEVWADAGPVDRIAVRRVAPLVIKGHVRHARAPRRLRHRRPADVGDVEGRQPQRRAVWLCATRRPGRSSTRCSRPAH